MNQRTGIFLGLGAVILVAILLVVFVFAGGDDDNGTTADAPSSGQPAAQGTTTGGNKQASGEFAALFNKFTSQRSWRAQMTIEAPGQPSQSANFEFVAPDKYRIVMSGGAAGAAGAAGSFEL